MYYITYWLDTENQEAHYLIYDANRKQLYSEDVIGNWDGDQDIEMTGLEIARSHDYWPAAIIQDVSEIPVTHSSICSKAGKIGGAAPHNRPKDYFSRIASLPRKRKTAK